jgi:hypothetical protein
MPITPEKKLLNKIARVLSVKTLDETSSKLRLLLRTYHDQTEAGFWPSNDQYREAANGHARDGECEIDDDAIVSRSDDNGAYVQAWIWIPNDDIPEPDHADEPMLEVRDLVEDHRFNRELKKLTAAAASRANTVQQYQLDDLRDTVNNSVRSMPRDVVLAYAKRWQLIDQEQFDALSNVGGVAA